jgi:hypothetical protein
MLCRKSTSNKTCYRQWFDRCIISKMILKSESNWLFSVVFSVEITLFGSYSGNNFKLPVWLATLPLYSQNATWRSSTANTVRIKPRSRIVIVFVGIYSRANSKYSVFCKSHTHHVYILCTIRQQLIPIKLRNQIIKFHEIALISAIETLLDPVLVSDDCDCRFVEVIDIDKTIFHFSFNIRIKPRFITVAYCNCFCWDTLSGKLNIFL